MLISATRPFLWIVERNKRAMALQMPPFDRLAELGFKEGYCYGGEWKRTTDKLWYITIGGYTLIFDIPGKAFEKPTVVTFTALITKQKFGKIAMEMVAQKLNERPNKPALLIANKQLSRYYPYGDYIVSVAQLKDDLEDFVSFLKEIGFEPDNSH